MEKIRVYDNGIYRDATQKEIDEMGKVVPQEVIDLCIMQLEATDYKAIKYAEGLISEADYAPIRAERQALRDRINELERELTE